MQIQTQKRYYTPAEYLELEEKAAYKNEYRNGEIISMTGGTTEHNKIALNFAAYFKFGMRGKGYQSFIGDVRLWIPNYTQYTYPDVMLVSGEPIYEGNNRTTIVNPCLIVEVLSKSTQNYDKGEKFTYYRSIPELQEYILIDQYSFHVEQLVKESENRWSFQEYNGENSLLKLGTIAYEISFRDLYEEVDLKAL